MTEFFDNEDMEILPDENGDYTWQCFVCGAIIKQHDKPDFCPFCKKEETYFIKIKNME